MPRSLSTRFPDIGATAVAAGRVQPVAMTPAKRTAVVATVRAERWSEKHVGNVKPSGVVLVDAVMELRTDEREQLTYDPFGEPPHDVLLDAKGRKRGAATVDLHDILGLRTLMLQLRERHPERRRHFFAGREGHVGFDDRHERPDDDRRQRAIARREIIEAPEHLPLREIERQLFLGLAHSGDFERGVTGFEAATGERHVAAPRITLQLRALDEQQLGFIIDHAQHRRHRGQPRLGRRRGIDRDTARQAPGEPRYVGVLQGALQEVVACLPSQRSPTVSQLASQEWVAVETVIDEATVRVIIPRLKSLGAEGIVEYPLNKVVY